jgi:autotransporter translocation and assembly factor TamB
MNKLNVNGKLTIVPIEINIPNQLPNYIQSIEVIKKGQHKKKQDQQKQVYKPPFGENVNLNIDLVIPNRMLVRGMGLETEWKGNIQVNGTLNNPYVKGNMKIVRGKLSLLNNSFTFQSATINLAGSIPPDPYLNIVAEITKKNITYQLRVQGTISAPNLTLTSNPSMSSDELLSRMLFRRRLTDITPIQAIQLAQSANTLRKGGDAFDIIGKTRNLLGVDQFEFRMGEGVDTTDVRVGIGKYISKDIYMDFEQGLGLESSLVTVEIELLPQIYLETEIGLDNQSGLGLFWKYDY